MFAVSEKRLIRFGLALFLCLAAACAPPPSTGACSEDPARLAKARVDAVIDGDTLRLQGGDRVRLIGINTPELGRDGKPPEPLADQARGALQRLVDAQGAVWLRDGREPRDKYGRRLAHVFDASGKNLAETLLARGLGFQVAVSPNFGFIECLASAERQARQADLGVWGHTRYEVQPVADLAPRQSGFTRLMGEVTHVSFKENGWWIQVGGKVGVRIKAADQGLFSRPELAALEGQVIEVRGWLVSMRDGWWMINLGHPTMLVTL
jgi:endonuclease YncB( thermonuclease family)